MINKARYRVIVMKTSEKVDKENVESMNMALRDMNIGNELLYIYIYVCI